MYRRRKVNKDDKPPIPTTIEGFNMVIKEDLSLRDKDEGNRRSHVLLYLRVFF